MRDNPSVLKSIRWFSGRLITPGTDCSGFRGRFGNNTVVASEAIVRLDFDKRFAKRRPSPLRAGPVLESRGYLTLLESEVGRQGGDRQLHGPRGRGGSEISFYRHAPRKQQHRSLSSSNSGGSW